MSHFYGTLDGRAKTQATRCGTKKSGITTQAASWQGAIRTRLWHEESTGTDMCEVSMIPWHGAGVKHVLYTGTVGEFKTPIPQPITLKDATPNTTLNPYDASRRGLRLTD